MPSIVLCDIPGTLNRHPLDSELQDHGFIVTRTGNPQDVERLSETGIDAVLFCVDDPNAIDLTALTAHLCRRRDVPVIVVGGELTEQTYLEQFATGVADHVSGRPAPGMVSARLLVAIERNETGCELRRGYAAFRKLFGAAASPMAIIEPGGRFVDANHAFIELLGYTLAELRRLDVARLTYAEDGPSLELFAQLARGECGDYQVQQRFVGRDGRVVWAKLHATSLVEPMSGAVHLIADLRDITPEVETHLALDRVRNRYRTLFEQVPSALLVVNLESMRFVEVNRAAERLFGYPRNELLGLGLANLWPGADRSPDGVGRLLRDERRLEPMRQRLRRKDGTTVDTEVTLTPPESGDGGNCMLLVRDTTSVRQLEEALERSRERLALDRQPSSLLHDLANLLSVLLDRSEKLLERLPKAEEMPVEVEELEQIGKRVVKLIRTFLASSRSASARPRSLELATVVAQSSGLLQALAGHRVELAIENDGEPLPIWFDRNELDQILLNLTTNARDAMQGRGRLKVTTGRSPAGNGQSSGFARLTVSDTGPGIAPELAEKIFIPYFTTKPGDRGSGIGLASVERLVRRSGGQIVIERREGDGAVFHVDLPLDAHRIETPEVDQEPRTQGGVTILLVDDDEAVCGLVREMLEAAGHRVLSAVSSRAAVRRARHYPNTLDLLIVDATLTDVSVPKLIERLRSDRPELRVLIISGYLDGVLMARGLLGHDTPFLSKPFTAAELLARIDETLALPLP